MISIPIQATLEALIPNTFLNMGDEEIITPYCVHKEFSTTNYLKSGIAGYSYAVEIAIIDDLPENIEVLVTGVKAAIEALAFTTSSGTSFESVIFEGDEPDFDMESKMYIDILKFTIETSNR